MLDDASGPDGIVLVAEEEGRVVASPAAASRPATNGIVWP
jgi:hypothetical protein